MDQDATPLLPRRLNRNVRAYINLYGEALPFQQMGDWPRKALTRITVVDTQSPPSIKGMTGETEIHLIDHHPVTERLDSELSWHIEEVGATATILVEQLQDLGTTPDMVQSTLLLLGIYEDTGSLSYAGTTPRDIRACAWLLENHANLNVASDFLNHPLSNGQRKLYDLLLENTETHDFHGLKIVLACGTAGDLVEEISTLAHKLRDVYDPDGLFVLVEMDDSIQMVARSTTDALDVGRMAEQFGGGGHDRAAAALIRGPSIQETRETLLERLAKSIEPAPTVGEIMSRDPQLLKPAEKIGEASKRMQRFGHEGYPVVDEGKVLGLLTRRAVDRAIAHGLQEEPITRIMQTGDVTVSVDDSIHYLQRLMIEHGWGQVPVVESEGEQIIGIVTRTDLLGALGSRVSRAARASLESDLEQALPAARLQLLRTVAEEAELRKDALYIVGGFVRDLILNKPSVDFDLVVEGDAIGLARGLAEAFGGKVSSHRRFGTAKWSLDGDDARLLDRLGVEEGQGVDLPGTLDFVSARTEFYPHPTALPSVRSGSIKLDLHRRDFTVNTLALRLDGSYYGRLLDHWGGGRDLREGKIRVLHSLSFMDDPTRMLRAVRLEQRLGFTIEARTLQLLEDALPLLDRVSGDRLRSEIDLIFDETELLEIFDRLGELGLLAGIHPALGWGDRQRELFSLACAFTPRESWELDSPPQRGFLLYSAWLGGMSAEETSAVTKRLSFPGALREDILAVCKLNVMAAELPGEIKPSEFVKAFSPFAERALVGAWIHAQDNPRMSEALDRYLGSWRKIQPSVDGETLRSHGLEPGPLYTEILGGLRDAWLDGQIKSKKDENQFLANMLEEAGQDG